MNILKKTMDWLSDSVKAVGKQKNFTGSGVDTRNAAERIDDAIGQTQESLDTAQRAIDIAQKGQDTIVGYVAIIRGLRTQLKATADALDRIARLTKNNPAIDQTYCKSIHEIASDGYEAAK